MKLLLAIRRSNFDAGKSDTISFKIYTGKYLKNPLLCKMITI